MSLNHNIKISILYVCEKINIILFYLDNWSEIKKL
jgi:hypothetical protein